MAAKRRRSSAGEHLIQPPAKRTRTRNPQDLLSDLSDELLIRILHKLPIQTLLQCQRLSHRFYTLAGDSQIWKNLYYNRFVLPRALRIPGIRAAQREEDVLHFSSRRSKWLDENTLVNRVDGKKTNWKGQYKLRYNWSIGACEVQEIHVKDGPSVPNMLVRLAEGIVLTADKEDGLRAWDLKEKSLNAKCELERDIVPTCLAIDEQDPERKSLGIAVGFMDGGWGTWMLDVGEKKFMRTYRHPASSNGMLSAVAYAHPYLLTITDSQLLSLYTFDPKPPIPEVEDPFSEKEDVSTDEVEEIIPEDPREDNPGPKTPTLLASLKSHTSWPPLSLSIRTTQTTLIASIAYSYPTYLSGYTIGIQELHLSLLTGIITSSRLTSALPHFSPSLSSSPSPSPSGTSSPSPSFSSPLNYQSHSRIPSGSTTRPTTLTYSHPYVLATHPDNTLTLHLCVSTPSALTLSPGTKLWGHTSCVSYAEITARGKAVSVSLRGNELRVWELEGGYGTSGLGRRRGMAMGEGSVRVRTDSKDGSTADSRLELGENEGMGMGMSAGMVIGREREGEVGGIEIEARKQWVGFDDEMVIVLKESGRGSQALMVYDFT